MTWGDSLDFLRQAGIRKDPPPLSSRQAQYFNAYQGLRSRRQYHANGPQPFEWGEIESYLRQLGGFAKGDIARKLTRLIVALDNEELKIYYEKAEAT